AAEDNVAELKMVRMVIGRTHSPAVKNACKAMIRDHTKQLSEIRQLASRFSVDLPTAPNVKHQALYKNMSHKSGRDLDRSFTGDQLQDHIEDVNTANDEVEVGQSAAVKRFARRAILTFAKHEQIWRGVAMKVGVPSTFGRPTAEQILNGKKIGS
ncbi:MAG TPA: DUF4142 domain-containing protein, partial [Fimbriimonas sp.]|nr:DUF4142 domain-containing protein [Fimbriimonas sp.]